MGGKKYRLEEVLPLLEEKDAKIARLELEVQAFAARASHMQGRFLSTLDALDELEAKHRLELDESQQEIHQLRTNLSRYIARVEAAESERDDMRDAVMQLVEKVEKSNDYSLWPHSRIRLARPADAHLIEGKNASASIRTREDLPSDEDLHAYASALIASLRVERDLERKAHAITRRDAEHRVALLEAQVARRDAELEACIFHPEHMSKLQAAEHEPKLVPLSAKDTSLSEEDIISVLEMTARRNRALELEVKEIAARLENARASCSSDGGETPTKLPGHSSPAQPEHLTSLNTPRASARRPCAARESNGLAALSSEDETIRVPDERRANAFAYARPSSDSEADMVPHWLHALHEQVAALGRQVQAFGEERDALARLVSGTKHPDTPNEPPAVNDPAHGGMGRIASPEHGPPVPPTDRPDEHAREGNDRERPPSVPPVLSNHDGVQDHDGGSEGERSMELATPVMPSVLFDGDQAIQVHAPDPAPRSPPPPRNNGLEGYVGYEGSPPPPSPHPPSERPRPDTLEATVARIEAALEEARRDIDAKETLLEGLRAEVREVRRWVFGDGPEGGGGDDGLLIDL